MTEQEKFYKVLREILEGLAIGAGVGCIISLVLFWVLIF